MTEYYLDASVLVKRYADEAGSVWIRQITDIEAENTIMLAEITLAEVAGDSDLLTSATAEDLSVENPFVHT